MPNYHYERLSAQDSTFLPFESSGAHMHIAWTWIFDAGPRTGDGNHLDIDHLRNYVASRLHLIPRYRQRLAYVPIENDPVWVDDDRFNIQYHVRHSSLPRPGTEEQLKRLTGRILSRRLDRARPLWEFWVVEGLRDGRLAVISKTHHCMVDGISTIGLMALLLRPTADAEFDPPLRWVPRPAPTGADLLADALIRRAKTPLQIARGVGNVVRRVLDSKQGLEKTLAATRQTIASGISSAPPTPLNQPIGPHRCTDWHTVDLNAAKEIRARLGGTVNDVVLATVAGAVRRFFKSRGFPAGGLDLRVVVPVNMRKAKEQFTLGNRASAWIISLPVDEADPQRCLERIRERTKRFKNSRQATGAEAMLRVATWAGANLTGLGVQVLNHLRPYNLIVTNIPGPQRTFYLLDAALAETYPQIPLFPNQGLSIALSSYRNRLCWGFNADPGVLPDLEEFIRAFKSSFRALGRAAAKAPPKRPAKKSRATKAGRVQSRARA